MLRKWKAVKGVPVGLKSSQKGVSEAIAVLDKSVRRIRSKLDVIESGASTSRSKSWKSPKTSCDNSNEALVRRTVNEFYVIQIQIKKCCAYK
jgi:hypothetical protein